MIIKKQLLRDLLHSFKIEKAVSLKGGLYHQTQIDFSYNSNKIEGNILS